jgi:hypothetical protein
MLKYASQIKRHLFFPERLTLSVKKVVITLLMSFGRGFKIISSLRNRRAISPALLGP